MRIGSFVYPAELVLDDGEVVVDAFAGLRGRVTLTETRIVLSRFGHQSIPYEDVVDVDGGLQAGPNWMNYRDNTTIVGGIYLCTVDWREEWIHIPDSIRAAGLIRERAANLAPVGEQLTEWIRRLKARRELAAADE
jgi:hypothetical protein